MSLIHEPLPSADSIRLLRLQPGVEGEAITCSLTVINNYKSAPEYYALSYCWGDANDTVDSFCNGTSLPITKSLHAALCRLRQKELPGLIFADAICIDQANIPERNQQVSIMPQIYQSAHGVFVWVGHGDEHSVSAVSAIRSIGHQCCVALYGPGSSLTFWLERLQEEDRAQMVHRTDLLTLNNTPANWRPFWQLYNKNWFFRVWVIQEVRKNARVQLLCGHEEIEWDFVALAANWVAHSLHRDRSVEWLRDHFPSWGGFHNAFFMWDQSFSTRREAPFLALLNIARHFNATDPRDKIFAMLQHPIIHIQAPHRCERKQHVPIFHPLAQSTTALPTHLNFRADYNMTTFEVYRKVALDSIRCYQNLEVLSYVRKRGDRDEHDTFPSWIPRWAVSRPTYDGSTSLLPFLFDAARGTSPKLQPASDESDLILQGLNLGPIVEATGVLRFGHDQDPLDYLSKEQSIKNSLMILSRILVQDRWQEQLGHENKSGRAGENAEAHFADFSAYTLPLLEAHKQDSYISPASLWCDFCRQFIYRAPSATSELSKAYSCWTCEYGNFDLCSSCYNSGKHCHSENHTLRILAGTHFWCPYTDEIVSVLRAHASTGDINRFSSIVTGATRHRIVFLRTSQGWRGAGPDTVEPGDILVVLFGSRVPFILRKSGPCYRLIGDCYVHGIMDGEAIQMWEDGLLNVEDFILH